MVLLLTMRNWNVSHILQRVISILVVGIVLVLIQYAAFPASSKSSKLPRDRGIHQGVNFQHREKPLGKESVFVQDQNLPLPFPDERDFGINSKDDDKKLTGIDAESHHQSPMKNGTKMKSGRKKAKMNEKSPWDEDVDESNDAFEEEEQVTELRLKKSSNLGNDDDYEDEYTNDDDPIDKETDKTVSKGK